MGAELGAQAAALDRSLDIATAAREARGTQPEPPWKGDANAMRIPTRTGDFGPLTYKNDDVLIYRLGAARVEKIKLLSRGSSRLLRVQDSGRALRL